MPTRRTSATPTSSEDGSSDDEQDFLDALTRKQVLEITEAFDAGAAGVRFVGKAAGQPSNKRRRVEGTSRKGKEKAREDAPAPGGFLHDGDGYDDMPGGSSTGGGGFMTDEHDTGGGGFLPEDADAASIYGGGGFLPESSAGRQGPPTAVNDDKPKSLLLDQIPNVLERLGLDGDDPSILSIFENASYNAPEHDGLQAVKRRNFLKVAALLVTQRDQEREEERAYLSASRRNQAKGTFVASGGGRGRAVDIDADEEQDADEHDDSDPLILSSNDEDDSDDAFNRDNEDSDPWADEDEIEGAFTGGRGTSPPRSRRTTRSRAKSGRDTSSPVEFLQSTDNGNRRSTVVGKKGKGKSTVDMDREQSRYKLSSKQKDECNRMFQQFFPNNDQSKNQAITMSEIRYVATLLNEKVSDEDVIEMLEYASTTGNKAVNLQAFSNIMVDVKAV